MAGKGARLVVPPVRASRPGMDNVPARTGTDASLAQQGRRASSKTTTTPSACNKEQAREAFVCDTRRKREKGKRVGVLAFWGGVYIYIPKRTDRANLAFSACSPSYFRDAVFIFLVYFFCVFLVAAPWLPLRILNSDSLRISSCNPH